MHIFWKQGSWNFKSSREEARVGVSLAGWLSLLHLGSDACDNDQEYEVRTLKVVLL